MEKVTGVILAQRSEGQIRYVLERNKRATSIRITVDAGRGAVVTAPVDCKTGLVEAFVREKSEWIAEKLARLAMQVGCPVPRKFITGEPFLFLGRRYVLKLVDSTAKPPVWLAGGFIHVYFCPALQEEDRNQIRDDLYRWYTDRARQVICARVEHYAKLSGLYPAGVRVKKQKYRWGSCSARGNLNFNWKLVMAPEPVIDYVVVHELCHLIKLDHSPEFWRLVARACPDYRHKRQWLRENGPALAF